MVKVHLKLAKLGSEEVQAKAEQDVVHCFRGMMAILSNPDG